MYRTPPPVNVEMKITTTLGWDYGILDNFWINFDSTVSMQHYEWSTGETFSLKGLMYFKDG